MEQQQKISLTKNQSFIGKTLNVLIEGSNDGLSMGRSYRDAPEIDGMVIVEGEVPVGEIVPVRISGAMAYDLTGVVEIKEKQIDFVVKFVTLQPNSMRALCEAILIVEIASSCENHANTPHNDAEQTLKFTHDHKNQAP